MTQKKKTRFKILLPPDDLSEIKNRIRKLYFQKAQRISVIVVLVLLAVCGTYILMKNQTYGKVHTSSQYLTNLSDSSNYASFSDGIVRYNRDGVVFLNHQNEEQWIQSTQLKNPVIVINENAFAVADSGGNNILVFSEEGLKGEIETTLPIEKVAVSDQGIVSVILKDESSPRILVYDATGNILVEQTVSLTALGYPVGMALSDDGQTLAVSYLRTDGTDIISSLVYYNFGEKGKEKQDNIVLSEQYDKSVIADIFFMGEDRSVVLGDHSFTIYKGNEEPEKTKEVTLDQEIQSVFHTDQYIGFVLLNEDKSGYELQLYNKSGGKVLTKEIPGKFSSVKMEDDEVLMFDGSRCCIVTANGIIKFNGDVGMNVLEMCPAFGINKYYVMNADELRLIYLSK